MLSGNDPLLLRRELVRDGSTDSKIRSAKADGTITPLRRGAFVSTATLTEIRAEERHRLAVRAHLAASTSHLVVSHQSAAVVHGFAMWAPDLSKVHLTVDRASGGRTSNTRHVHAALLPAEDVTVIDGIPVTSPDRTIADLLRVLPFEEGVCVADAALHAGSATIDGIANVLARTTSRGTIVGGNALEFSDAKSESVGESRSRVLIHRLGFPKPRLQVSLYSPGGLLLGRADMLWDVGVVGESDGVSKYTKYLQPGRTAADAVIAEKKREDEIRSYGSVFARWTWSDLENPKRFAAILQRAFDLAKSLPPPRTVNRL